MPNEANENQAQTPEQETQGFVVEAFNNGAPVEQPKPEQPAKEAAESDEEASEDGEEGEELEEPADEDDLEEPAEESDEEADEDEEESSEEQPEAEDEGEEEPEEAPKPKRKLSPGERIAQLTRKMRDAERERDIAREALRKAKPAEQPDSGDLTGGEEDDTSAKGPPDPKDYDYGELDPKYLDDRVAWAANQQLKKYEERQAKVRQQAAAAQEAQELVTKARALAEKGRKEIPGFDDRVKTDGSKNDWDCGLTTFKLIVESPVGHKVADHLARNPKLAAQIAKQDDIGQAASFGRLEARFSAEAAPKPKPKPKVPAPLVRKARGTGSGARDPLTGGDFASFEAHARKQGF